MSDTLERVRFRGQPLAHPQSIVVAERARFTVLTPCLLRLEWSETGQWEDRSSYAFPDRYNPQPPKFNAALQEDELAINSGPLLLRYRHPGERFSADNLSIEFKVAGSRQVWRPGLANPGNLRGTRRTLDWCAGDAALDAGLLSRDGWALVDDSRAIRFSTEEGWPQPAPDHELQDWYFFGYGHDYQAALADYSRFGGRIPLIPRFVLGAWWSRYWAYRAEELQELVGEFEAHGLPLDVLVIDMDWHTPDSWTGYTWNRELFPDPPAFLEWAHQRGLHVTLNLHPAEGVQPFEEAYPRFARAMGLSAKSKQAVPFQIGDPTFVKHYFELLHHPLEEQGVDFWWVDWQQGESSDVPGLDPLPWLNHLHFRDAGRRGQRPLLYSRWGGLGNHRYPIGFSGDTLITWEALQFQPYMTATAANVGYGWWSHDIGGHMGGATPPELYARWVQFGALSPCLRLHSTKDALAERRPWKYPPQIYQAAKNAFLLRYCLQPYIYTMARLAHDSGISLCRPMYYEYPEQEAAYAARYQYFFGDQLIAAPIVYPADPQNGLAASDVWIPPGTWIEYSSKESFQGPRWVRLVGDLEYMPMLVRAGGILPLAGPFAPPPPPHLASGTSTAIPADRITLAVFAGPQGGFRLYQDDGLSQAHREGQYEWSEIRSEMPDPHTWNVYIAPVEGHCEALPTERQIEVHLEGSRRPQKITLDGQEIAGWRYDADKLRTIIPLPPRDKRAPLRLTALGSEPLSALGEAHNQQVIQNDVRRLLRQAYPRRARNLNALIDTVLYTDVPGKIDAIARLGGPLLRFIEFATPEEASRQLGRAIVETPARPDEPYDLEISFTLLGPAGHRQQHAGRVSRTTYPQIIDTPFRWHGRLEAQRWEAQVLLSWRGQTWQQSYHSRPILPSIHTWRALAYDEEQTPLPPERVLDREGRPRPDLNWRTLRQDLDQLRSLNDLHIVWWGEERPRLRAGEPVAGYLATTIVCPDERLAALALTAGGEAICYLNGQRLTDTPLEEGQGGHPLPAYAHWLGLYRSETFRLRRGENTLLVQTRPPQQDWPGWYFGAALMWPDGRWMGDLGFEG